MKLTFAVAALGLVAGASAAQVHLKVDTAEELSGTFKAEDGTVMHFQSTPAGLKLADANMQQIWDSESVGQDITQEQWMASLAKIEHSNVAKNAGEFSEALGDRDENELAVQFHDDMVTFAQYAERGETSPFELEEEEEDEDEDEELVEEEAQWGRRRRRRRRRRRAAPRLPSQCKESECRRKENKRFERFIGNWGNWCGRCNGWTPYDTHCAPSSKGKMDDFCREHDKCLHAAGWTNAGHCDDKMCGQLKQRGFCKWWDFKCKLYARTAKGLICKRPNA